MNNDVVEGLQDLKSKVLNGEEIPAEEYKKIIESLRLDRTARAIEGKKTTKKRKASIIPSTLPLDLDDLWEDKKE